MKINYILLILYINLACTGNDKENYESIFFNADNILHLKIEDQMFPVLHGRDYFSIEKIIKLETRPTSLLGNNLDKVILYNERIYVLDSHIGKGVYVFDMDGNFLNKIVEEIDGPLQMTMIKDFVIDPINDEIQLLDMRIQKVFKFTLDGVYKSEMETPIEAVKFELLNNQYVFHPVKNSDYETGYYLNSWPVNEKDIVGSFPYVNNRNGQFSWSHKISTYENTVNFWEPFNDTIYQLKENFDMYKIFVDFGARSIDKTIWDKDLSYKVSYVESLRGKKFLLVNNVISTRDYLYFNFLSYDGYRNVIYDYKSGKKKIFGEFSLGENKHLKKIHSLANNNYLYTVITESDNNTNLVKVNPGDNPAIILLKLNSSNNI